MAAHSSDRKQPTDLARRHTLLRSLKTLGAALGLATLLSLMPQPSHASLLLPDDAQAVRVVVQAQLTAFASDDAEGAFSHAATSIQARFGDAPAFMALVRTHYPMLLNPATVLFLLPESDLGQTRQVVKVRDRAGHSWLAIYELEKEPGAAWRIKGCVVLPDKDASASFT